jgi:hypothetical protein
VLVVGFARGKVKATNKPFEDDWIFAITVRDGKLTSIREYLDTQHWRGPRRWMRPGWRSAGRLQLSVRGRRGTSRDRRPARRVLAE